MTIADNDVAWTDHEAMGKTAVADTVSGTYVGAHASDNAHQSITERLAGCKPANRHSHLEHQWTVDVTGGSTVPFYVEAHQMSQQRRRQFRVRVFDQRH